METADPAASAAAILQPVPFNDAAARRGQGFRSVEILPGNIGLVDMREFVGFEKAEDPARLQADAVLQYLSTADAIIFDLRQNGGGSPAMVGYLVSAFVPADADVYNVFRSRSQTTTEAPRARYSRPRPDVPLFVVTSGRSASAAEGFAYTLQAAKRALVVGEVSSGAANPGDTAITPSGWRIFVSTGSPVNPITGGNWETIGVTPDVPAEASVAVTSAWRAALALQTDPDRGTGATEAGWVLEALGSIGPNDPVDLAGYGGEYTGSKVSIEGDHLVWRMGRRPLWRLRPLAADLFTDIDEPYRRIRFQRNEAGQVDALEVLDSHTGSTRFLRRDLNTIVSSASPR